MTLFIIGIFIIAYAAIALEHVIHVNKTAVALMAGIVCWTLFMLSPSTPELLQSDAYTEFLQTHTETVSADAGHGETLSPTDLHHDFVSFKLSEKLAEVSQIIFFLMGAMTIVEVVDSHQGFRLITDKINTRRTTPLLWAMCIIAFLMSSVLDNLTTTIVMVSVIRKLLPDKHKRLVFASMIVISANAGGAWTPIGDVTTTMLWIGGQITTMNIIKTLFIPSVVCMIAPLIVLSIKNRNAGNLDAPPAHPTTPPPHAKFMLALGLAALISVPVFKTFTHMPPYAGMLLGLSVMWIASEFIAPAVDEKHKKHYTVVGALSRIDVSSILFFLGILLAVDALESMQVLHGLASWLEHTLGDQRIIITITGIISAIIDNVPLVAASMGMYDMHIYPTDHMIWEYLAYCAGTGGSILIIGSAAGVAAMGMENINFGWYFKRISLLALLGYLAGAATYFLIR